MESTFQGMARRRTVLRVLASDNGSHGISHLVMTTDPPVSHSAGINGVSGFPRDANPAKGWLAGTIPLAGCRESVRFTKQIGPAIEG